MIRLGIEYGLVAALDGACPPDVWLSWSKLWAVIWSRSWSAELSRLEKRGLALFRQEVIADRVLAASLRILRSMEPD